jgi:hypothetical protein
MKPAHTLIILVTGLCLCSGLTALCQRDQPTDDVHAILLAGKKRSLLAYAGKEHSFTLDLQAHPVKLSDVPGFVTIDQQIIQSTLVPVDPSFDLTHNSPAREQDILTRYMNFELAYYKKKLHQSYSNLQTDWVTQQNRIFLVWYFDMPKNNKLISRQIYVSTLFFDQVMDLNAPVFHAGDSEKAKAILLRLAGTMKTYDKHLDLAAMGKRLNK